MSAASKNPLAIIYRAVDTLIPYARNSRVHSPFQISQIAKSIREFGFTNALLLDEDNGIIAGHGRLAAAKQVGLETVPCVTLIGLTETQKKALVIADNKLALNASWDVDMLAMELGDISSDDDGFDLETIGFSTKQLSKLLEGDLTDPTEDILSPKVTLTSHTCPECGHQWTDDED